MTPSSIFSFDGGSGGDGAGAGAGGVGEGGVGGRPLLVGASLSLFFPAASDLSTDLLFGIFWLDVVVVAGNEDEE